MSFRTCLITAFCLVIACPWLYAQEKEKYILGHEQQLEIIVHVWGEVQNPGEYRVPDDTNILELISKAGGTTEFSKLSDVRLTRALDEQTVPGQQRQSRGSRILRLNLDNYFKKENSPPPPILKPGDIVFVPRNGLYKWRTVVGFARDFSVIASVVFIAVRAANDL